METPNGKETSSDDERDAEALPLAAVVIAAGQGKRMHSERAKVLFTHLNHTNPAADPAGAAARRIRAQGCGVASEGQIIRL